MEIGKTCFIGFGVYEQPAAVDTRRQPEQADEGVLEQGRAEAPPFVGDVDPETCKKGYRLRVPTGTLAHPRRRRGVASCAMHQP